MADEGAPTDVLGAVSAAKPQTAESGLAGGETAEKREQSAGMLALLDAGAAFGAIPMPRIGADPPTEFRAFVWGDNATTKGTLRLTADGARQVMDSYRARGVVKSFDYAHSTYNPMALPEGKKAAGQFLIELRPDGLWFTQIQWTKAAAEAIRAGEWPYISPAVKHTKSGEITEVLNAALVTDPGTVNATPTILSDSGSGSSGAAPVSPPTKGTRMDKKRAVLDAYAALESAARKCQGLADTDGVEKDLGNRAVGHMAPLMDSFRSHMSGSGYLEDAAMGARSLAARDKMFSTLSAEIGETDPEKLSGKILAKLLAVAPAPSVEGVLLSADDAQKATALLLDGSRSKYPSTKRASLEALSLPGVVAFLSAANEDVPMGPAVREVAPPAPTSKHLDEVMAATPKPAALRSGRPTSLAECDERQRARVEMYLENARSFMGSAFNEQVETQHALTLLSDDADTPKDNSIRHLPYGVDHSTGKATTLSEGF